MRHRHGLPPTSERVGISTSTRRITIAGPAHTETRRRQALDQYVPSLGTSPQHALDAKVHGVGGSVWARVVLDIAGWSTDTYVPVERDP